MRRNKRVDKAHHEPEQSVEELEGAVDLPNREVMTLIDPNMLGGGLGGGLMGGSSPTGGTTGAPTDPSAAPTPAPGGVAPGGVPSTGLGALDKFMPSANGNQPYDPNTSATNQS